MNLHPSQFEVDESWILFKLTRKPIITEHDGPVVCFGLMDAASCFILGFIAVPGGGAVSQKDVQELLTMGWAHKKEYPNRLLVPQELLNGDIEAVAQVENISIVCVPERELVVIIGEAQEEFEKRFC